jgi:hypothetical protein
MSLQPRQWCLEPMMEWNSLALQLPTAEHLSTLQESLEGNALRVTTAWILQLCPTTRPLHKRYAT